MGWGGQHVLASVRGAPCVGWSRGRVTGEADGAGALLPATPRPGADRVPTDTDRHALNECRK